MNFHRIMYILKDSPPGINNSDFRGNFPYNNVYFKGGIPEEMAVLMDLHVGDYVYMEIQIENDNVQIMLKREDKDHDAIIIRKAD